MLENSDFSNGLTDWTLSARNLDCSSATNTNRYHYKNKGKRTSLLIDGLENTIGSFNYKYDKLNNITHIYKNGILINKYLYDSYNQLIEEYDYILNQKNVYSYDLDGNLLSKSIYNLNTNILINEKIYQYNNPNINDQLINYDGISFQYDSLGNPTNIGNDTLIWTNGRQLKKYNNIEYKYNKDGIRTYKKVDSNNIIHYYLEENKIIVEKHNNYMIYYLYSDVDNLVGFLYNNNIYFYIKNLQGDIIAIIDINENVIAKYLYDSFGNIISITDENDDIITNPSHIGLINPFRYRSYYYDSETNLYYLNNRYYSPTLGRFINMDGVINSNKTFLSHNLFSYCDNNYINNVDSSGKFAIAISFAPALLEAFATTVKVVSTYLVISSASKAITKNPPKLPSITITHDSKGATQARNRELARKKYSENVMIFSQIKEMRSSIINGDTPIYRYGEYTPEHFTPEIKDIYDGLSFSTRYKKEGNVTTINAINSTGILCADADGPTHVSVKPCDDTVENWMLAGPNSIYTKTIMSVTKKWSD